MTPVVPTEPSVANAGWKPGDPRSDLMDPDTRDRILTALAALSRERPTLRFGQLVCAVASMAADAETPDDVYGVEDEKLLIGAERWLDQLRADR